MHLGRLTRVSRKQTRRSPVMTTQIDTFRNEGDWLIPALLVVLMTMLAMLGIVANVAAA